MVLKSQIINRTAIDEILSAAIKDSENLKEEAKKLSNIIRYFTFIVNKNDSVAILMWPALPEVEQEFIRALECPDLYSNTHRAIVKHKNL